MHANGFTIRTGENVLRSSCCVCLEPLTTLIDAAREAGVTFVYAISPGLDITYSSSKDVVCLKHKLEQVSSFGCEAFAVLFDDIDVELCDADKSLYQSFASAQASDHSATLLHFYSPDIFEC